MTQAEQPLTPMQRPHVVTHERRPEETEVFYARSLEDPLVVAFGDQSDRQRLARLASMGLHESIGSHQVSNAIDFATDYAYRAFGIADIQHVTKATNFAGNTIERELKTNEQLTPLQRMKLQSRQLDVMSLQVFGQYHSGKEARSADQNKKALTLLEASAKDVIIRGAEALKTAQKVHEDSGDQKMQSDIRGLMFEQLFITYQRLNVYEQERYDETVVLGATVFEDNAARSYEPKNHNYDVLAMNADGSTGEVVQCKNAQDGKQYEKPIRKIQGHNFIRFVSNPDKFISAISRLANNSAGVSERQLQEDQALLDDLFEAEKINTNPMHQVGELATLNS